MGLGNGYVRIRVRYSELVRKPHLPGECSHIFRLNYNTFMMHANALRKEPDAVATMELTRK